MTAYYNEIEPTAAHVLECLIKDGAIAPGIVDRRSIAEVEPGDLDGFTQAHFFAGGGIWSVAARLAGWPDDRRLWTGSCPCQPISVAGKKKGADDPRHLWPDFHRLIRACRPAVVVGEQVSGKNGYHWFDGVASDLEGDGYSAEAIDIPACAVNSPHVRSRLYWRAVVDADGAGCREHSRPLSIQSQHAAPECAGGDPRRVADPGGVGCDGRTETPEREAQQRAAPEWSRPWDETEWIEGADGKFRRIKPGLRLLVDGLPGRVGLIRIGGNAIVAPLAAAVLQAVMESIDV